MKIRWIMRLPTRAKVMLSGLDSEGEIGVCPRGANPGAVDSDSKRGITYFAWGFPEVFGDIDQRLAGLELSGGLAKASLSVKLGVQGTACSLGLNWARVILRECGSGESKNER